MTAAARQHFRSVAAALRDGTLPAADDVKRLADAFDQIAQGASADIAFGLRLKPGQHQSQDQIAARDELLRTTALRFWPGASVAEQTRQLSRALKNYCGGRWQRDRAADKCPHPDGAPESYLFRVLKLRDLAVGERQMHRILTSAQAY